MYILSNKEEKDALMYLDMAEKVACGAMCIVAKCGSIIVKDSEVIGAGFNSPPMELESQRRCTNIKNEYDKRVTDKTCCVHAEQRAIMDALQNNSSKLPGARLYFIRINDEGDSTRAGKPYCTICSKMALDVGIAEFALWHEEGICVYDTQEYNTLSYAYS